MDDPLDFIAGIVLGQATAGVAEVALAPVKAYSEHYKERVADRLKRVRERAAAKSDGPLNVDDRLAFKVLTEASFTDDELMADYLGGVLAASDGTDDAAAVVAQIGRLSAAQLRFHYIVYREVARANRGRSVNLYDDSSAWKGRITIDVSEIIAALGRSQLVNSLLVALHDEGLLAGWEATEARDERPATVTVGPTARGAELFLWGMGVQHPHASTLLLDVELPASEIPACPSAALTDPHSDPAPDWLKRPDSGN